MLIFSVVPRGEDKITPVELNVDIHETDKLTEGIEDSSIQTPVIIPVQEEPKYVKNFNAFIEQTHQHLNQVLANNQRIDDVHGIVTEIQKPAPAGTLLTAESAPDLIHSKLISEESFHNQNGRVTSDLTPGRSDTSTVLEESVGTRKSMIKTPKQSSTRATTSRSTMQAHRSIGKIEPLKLKSISERNLIARSAIQQSKFVPTRKITTQISSTSRTGRTEKGERKSLMKNNPTSVKSISSRTLAPPTLSSRNLPSCSISKRESGMDTARTDRSNWKDKKMTSVPISVINLQL